MTEVVMLVNDDSSFLFCSNIRVVFVSGCGEAVAALLRGNASEGVLDRCLRAGAVRAAAVREIALEPVS